MGLCKFIKNQRRMNLSIILTIVVSIFTASALSLPLSPYVSEVDIPADSGPVILVLEQVDQHGAQDDDPQIGHSIHALTDDDDVEFDQPEDFVKNTSQQVSDIPNPHLNEGEKEKEKKPVAKPQKPAVKPQKPAKPATPKPQKPKPQKPKPQKPSGKPKPQKPVKPKPQKPSGAKPKPQKPGRPQRPIAKPQRPGKPGQKPGVVVFETDVSNEETEYTSTLTPDEVDIDYDGTTPEPDEEIEEDTPTPDVTVPVPPIIS